MPTVSEVVVIADANFEQEVMAAAQPVLAYFWADWCGPCRLMSPAMDAIAQEFGDRVKVVKLEVDANPAAVKQWRVEGVPALRLFKERQLVAEHEGAITKAKLIDWLNTHLENGLV